MSLLSTPGLRMNSVLVVGGAGLAGASFCHSLAKAGYVPVVFDNPKPGYESRVKWGPLIRGSVLEREKLRATIAEYKPETIVYCPAVSRPEMIMADPAIAYRTHMGGLLTLLDVAREKSISQFLLLSSAAIYGDAGHHPIREEHAAAPISPLGSSLMICERMIRDYAGMHALRYAVLRVFSVAGANPEIHLQEDLDNHYRLVPNLIAVAAGLRPHVTLHGSNYATRDGTPVRDYIHASDLAEAMILALRAIELGAEPRTYNIGSGNGTSALELVSMAERVSGKRIPIAYGVKRSGDPATVIADASLARVMLGWTPKQSAADQIIRSAWTEWLNDAARDKNSRAAS